MPRVTRSASSRVPQPDPSLPAPTTARTLISRSRATSLARSARSSRSGSRASSLSGGNSRRPSSVTGRTSAAGSRAQTPEYEYEDIPLHGLSSMMVETSEHEARPTVSRGTKRKRPRHVSDEPTSRTPAHREWGTSDDDEEIDQLLSDDEQPIASTSASNDARTTAASETIIVSDESPSEIVELEGSSSASRNNDSPQRGIVISSPVSSPSLAKLLHATNVDPQKTKGKEVQHSPPNAAASSSASGSKLEPDSAPETPQPEPLSEYTCPICFFPPTNATLTPCGHVCCGSCLFTAVKTTMQRSATAAVPEANIARCPVCRAPIPGWDGRGGGVIGLKVRAVFSM